MSGAVAWISTTPVKGLRLQDCTEVAVNEDGVPGDRAFFLIDANGAMVSATRLGPLVAVVAEHDPHLEWLCLSFPRGKKVAGPVRLGEPERVGFHGLSLGARPVEGKFSKALSDHCGTSVRLMAMPSDRPGIDRGREGAVTLLSVASLERLREQADLPEPVDRRRFRMTFGVEGVDAHEEDGWIGRELRIGEVFLRVTGNVGRCAVTTRQPETGDVDLKTLQHLADYRSLAATTEPLPFGVYARVIVPGVVSLGDRVELI
jgi:uncharacterized protein YcbX